MNSQEYARRVGEFVPVSGRTHIGLYAPVAVCALELGLEVFEAGNHAGPVTALIGEMVGHLLVPAFVFGVNAPLVDFDRVDRIWGKPSAKLRHIGSVRAVQTLAASYVRNARMLSGEIEGRSHRLGVMSRETHEMLDQLAVLSGYHGYTLGEVAARNLEALSARSASPVAVMIKPVVPNPPRLLVQPLGA